MEIIRSLKERICSIVQQINVEGKQNTKRDNEIKDLNEPIEYILPDNTKINIANEKYIAPEILFAPEIIGYEYMGIHQMLMSTVNKAEIGLRGNLYENIVIAGAGSKFSGLLTRMLNEIKSKRPRKENVRRI